MKAQIEVLLVAEKTDVIQTIQGLMDSEGDVAQFHITHVELLGEAIHLLEDDNIHLVVFNLNRQNHSGLDGLCSLLRAVPQISVIVIVESREEVTGIAAKKLGIQEFLVEDEITYTLLSKTILSAIERQAYQTSLETYEQQILQASIDASKPIIAILNGSGDILAVNSAWRTFTGSRGGDPEERHLGASYLDVCAQLFPKGETEAAAIAAGLQSVMGGQQDIVEIEYNCHTLKQHQWFNCRITSFSKTPRRVMVAHEDVSDRKRTEEALRISEEQLQVVIDTSPNCVYITDQQGRYVLANQTIADLCGLSTSQMIGKTDSELFGNSLNKIENKSDVISSNHIQNEPQKFPLQIDSSLKSADGRVRCFSTTKKSIRLPGGSDCIVNIAADVTELLHAQDDFRNTELRLQTILDAQTNKVMLLDPRRRILWPNSKACQEAGLARHEIIGRKCHEVWGEQSEHCQICPVELALKSGQTHSITRTMPDGCTWRVHGFPVRDEKGCIVSAVEVVEDITERVTLEGQLRQAQKMESLGTLAGGIAHDFNNILSGILGYTELALEKTKGSPTLSKYLDEVYGAGLRAAELTKQILTFSRRTDVECTPLKIEPIILQALRLLRSTLPTSIEFEVKIDHKLAPILADPTQIHQVVMNLCTNASHAMEPYGGVLGVELTHIEVESGNNQLFGSLAAGDYLKLCVSDSGCGMPPEVMASIFDPYFTTKDLGEGTGLGLSVVHGIVNEYGGTIQVDSSPGKGTTFSLFFPTLEKIADNGEQLIIEELARGYERILVVDDEPVILKLCTCILKNQGFKVKTENDSLRALELFKSDPGAFDLVLSDVTMPKMTGDLLAKEIMSIRPDIPVILCTGHSRVVTEEYTQKMGVRALLTKPVVKRQLLSEVRKALDR